MDDQSVSKDSDMVSEISAVEEMDEVATPLIKRLTIMSVKLLVATALITSTLVVAPQIGLADDSVVHYSSVEKHDQNAGGVEGWKNWALNKAAVTKEKALSIRDGIFDADEKLQRAKAENKALLDRNAQLERDLVETRVNAGIDHELAIQRLEQALSYLKSLDVPE